MTSIATYPTISNWLDNHRDELIQKSCYIFEHPETAYKEKLSSKCLRITWKHRISNRMEYCWNRDCIYCGLDQS